MDIMLDLINQSADANNSSVVIFQKNVAANLGEMAVAWKVIQNLRTDYRHSFVFPLQLTVGASDSHGDATPQQPAEHGQLFTLAHTPSGWELKLSGPGTSREEIQILNALPQGAIDANIYRGNALLATRTGVAPQQKAVFRFEPAIWIGVALEVVQGQVLTPAVVSQIDTELSLAGIRSADIVMTGGGPGKTSTPFRFDLANVVKR
jgi:hypothetical protein